MDPLTSFEDDGSKEGKLTASGLAEHFLALGFSEHLCHFHAVVKNFLFLGFFLAVHALGSSRYGHKSRLRNQLSTDFANAKSSILDALKSFFQINEVLAFAGCQ